jgi:hypothetical protein
VPLTGGYVPMMINRCGLAALVPPGDRRIRASLASAGLLQPPHHIWAVSSGTRPLHFSRFTVVVSTLACATVSS